MKNCKNCLATGYFSSSVSGIVTKCPKCRGLGKIPLHIKSAPELEKAENFEKKTKNNKLSSLLKFFKAK